MKKIVDINSDMGESFGRYVLGNDENIMPYITSVNIACGLHAGDPMVINKTVKLAKQFGLGVGAHPGYPDMGGFGRRSMKIPPDDMQAYVLYQIGALKVFLDMYDVKLQHVKPHGAFYNDLIRDEKGAQAFAEGVAKVVPDALIYFIGSISENCLQYHCEKNGLKIIKEFNSDTDYNSDGSIVIRQKYGDISIHDSVNRTIDFIKNGEVKAIDGTILRFEADSICVHGDNDHTLEAVQLMRDKLIEDGYKILAPSQW